MEIYELWNVIKRRSPDFNDPRCVEEQEVEAFALEIRDATLERIAEYIESTYDRPDIAESIKNIFNAD